MAKPAQTSMALLRTRTRNTAPTPASAFGYRERQIGNSPASAALPLCIQESALTTQTELADALIELSTSYGLAKLRGGLGEEWRQSELDEHAAKVRDIVGRLRLKKGQSVVMAAKQEAYDDVVVAVLQDEQPAIWAEFQVFVDSLLAG
jgi:hypothetical protein